MINWTNECLIYVDSQNLIEMVSNSAQSIFATKRKNLIGIHINKLFNVNNPEIALMIKNSMMQTHKDYIAIENITFWCGDQVKKESKRIFSLLFYWLFVIKLLNLGQAHNTSRTNSDKAMKRSKINLYCYKLKDTLYSLGHVFVIQPIVSK